MRRSGVEIFRNERTRSTPLEPKLMFWCVLVQLGQFGCLTNVGGKRAELVQKFVPRRRVRIFRSECTQSTLFDPKLTFWCIFYHLGAFGTIWLPYETLWKTGGSFLQKFVPRSRVGIFRNERTRSTSLDPKLKFWCVFVLFGCIRDHLVALRNSVQNGPN